VCCHPLCRFLRWSSAAPAVSRRPAQAMAEVSNEEIARLMGSPYILYVEGDSSTSRQRFHFYVEHPPPSRPPRGERPTAAIPSSPTQTVAGLAAPPAPAWVAHDGSLPKPLPKPYPNFCLLDPPMACTMIPATANRIARLPSGTDIEGRNRKAVEFPRTPASGRQSAVGLRRNGAAR
jgi:hypothetical protein